MSNLHEVLFRIEFGLRRLGRSALIDSLLPGLSVEDVGRQMKAAGLCTSFMVEELYSWKDGTETSGKLLDDIQMFPGFFMLSMEDAVVNYRTLVRDSRWSAGWVPLFANGGGDFYLVELGHQSCGAVRHFRIDETDHPIEFRSVFDMMSTLAAGFDLGVFFVDEYGYLEMNDPQFADLAATMNPSVAWWRD